MSRCCQDEKARSRSGRRMCQGPDVGKRPGVQRARDSRRRESGKAGRDWAHKAYWAVGKGIWIVNQEL